jgi:hypothetical protein
LFAAVQAEADELFLLLGVGEGERGEFREIGDSDLTPERFDRYQGLVEGLQSDIQQRQSLLDALKNQLLFLSEELEEPVSDELQGVLNGNVLTNSLIDRVKQAVEEFESLKIKRTSELDQLRAELEDLYTIMAIDSQKQLKRGRTISQAAITATRNEIASLGEEKETRLTFVIRAAQRELAKLCVQLRVSIPKFGGGSLEEEARFLAHRVQEMKQRKVEVQPIVELITQISSCREVIEGKATQFQVSTGSPRRNAEEERAKRIAKETLPKLERRLTALLVEFKRKNGRDFHFKGVNYGELYAPKPVEMRSRRVGSPVKKTPQPESEIRQRLLEKMDQSLSLSASWSTPLRGDYLRTGRGRPK